MKRLDQALIFSRRSSEIHLPDLQQTVAPKDIIIETTGQSI